MSDQHFAKLISTLQADQLENEKVSTGQGL